MGIRNVTRKSEGRSPSAIGARLTLTRGIIGGNQKEFAERADVGKSTYNQYEKGKQRPDLDEAIKLCDRYGLTLDWIYFGDPSGLKYSLAEAVKSVRQARNTDK